MGLGSILAPSQESLDFIKIIERDLPSLVGPLFVTQLFSHPWTLTSPDHWVTLGNQYSGLPEETISLSVLCAANIRCPGISNLHRHCPLRVPILTLIDWSLRDSFIVPREIHVRPVQDSNQGPLEIQSQGLDIWCVAISSDPLDCSNYGPMVIIILESLISFSESTCIRPIAQIFGMQHLQVNFYQDCSKYCSTVNSAPPRGSVDFTIEKL